MNETKDQAEVKIHYRIRLFFPDDKLGLLSEGDSVFTLDLREGEWRIAKWFDQSLSPEELKVSWNQLMKSEDSHHH